jgi:glycogen synthase kinase 3 beta
LAWIHSHGVSHRDLKPENVLLSREGVVKICDFGSSKVLNQKGKNTPFIVSRFYRAPELILCVSKYSVEIDVWAAGCILAEMVLLEPVFRGASEGEQMFKILEVMGSMSEEEVEGFQGQVPFDRAIFAKF